MDYEGNFINLRRPLGLIVLSIAITLATASSSSEAAGTASNGPGNVNILAASNVSSANLSQTQRSPLCSTSVGSANDGPEAINELAGMVATLFWNNEDLLKRSVDDWNTPTCVFEDGRPKMSVFQDGLNYAFKNQSDWSKSKARLEYLKNKFPNEAFVALAESRYWCQYAWNARGSGFASSVTPEGWKLFRERLERAEATLINTKTYSSQIPDWYVEMIIVQSALDRPEEERDKTFIEGTQKFKTFYPIYFTMLNYLSPKWGGSWETVDNLVTWTVEHTQTIEGNSMYARLYWAASGGLPQGDQLFKNTRAKWKLMKKGFEDLMRRHPKSNWNLNNFAKFACQAGDKSTFLSLRKQIGANVINAAWSGDTTLDLCEAKYGFEQ